METIDDEQAQDVLPQDLEETLYLLSVPGMRESVLAGMAALEEECSAELPR